MKKLLVSLIIFSVFSAMLLSSCGNRNSPSVTTSPADTSSSETDGTRTVTDSAGRAVTIPKAVKRPVCIGAGALRLYSYIGDMSILAGVEECEKGFLISARPYQYSNENLFKSLPTIGTGGPQGTADAEAILSVSPDVIFAVYVSFEPADFDEIQKKTGVPVIALSYGKSEAFDSAVESSLKIMGEVLNRTDEAEKTVNYINSIKNDLSQRTKDIPESDKKSAYLGCLNKFGSHGIGSSTANYSLFDAVNAVNVLDKAGYKGYQGDIDAETILKLNPDVIIVDAGGLGIFKDEYAKKTEVFNSLSAIKSGEVYVQMPYNAYYTNLEIAYANAYFIGKTLFPKQFADITPAEKLNEITKTLLGTECADYVFNAVGIEYGKLDMNQLLQTK